MIVVYKVTEVAKEILNIKKEVSSLKLKILLFYCQAWSLVWDDAPLFEENINISIEYTPVIFRINSLIKEKILVTEEDFNSVEKRKFHKDKLETIKQVLKNYGDKSLQELSILIRTETIDILAYEKNLSYYNHEYLKHFYTLRYLNK